MWRSLGCRPQLQVFAADGLKFEHGPLRAWLLQAWRPSACTLNLMVETTAAPCRAQAAIPASWVRPRPPVLPTPSPTDLSVSCTAPTKNKLSKSRTNARFVVTRGFPYVQTNQRPCGLMDKALVFGTKDCRFESCQGHTRF